MVNEHYYEVGVAWHKDRMGIMNSPDLPQAIEVATPPQFAKGMAGIWSPEHLFVGAVNSCLMTTFLAIAENSRLQFTDFTTNAIGKLEMIDGKFLISEITLKPIITITSESEKVKAEKVILKAEAACLISNSVKSKITLIPEIKIGTTEQTA